MKESKLVDFLLDNRVEPNKIQLVLDIIKTDVEDFEFHHEERNYFKALPDEVNTEFRLRRVLDDMVCEAEDSGFEVSSFSTKVEMLYKLTVNPAYRLAYIIYAELFLTGKASHPAFEKLQRGDKDAELGKEIRGLIDRFMNTIDSMDLDNLTDEDIDNAPEDIAQFLRMYRESQRNKGDI